MINTTLLVNLLIGHMIADFAFQSDALVKNKQEYMLCGYGMWWHSLVVLACTWLVIGEFSLWYIAFGITITHTVIDYLKVKFTHNGPRAFAVDQFLHIFILVLASKCCPGWQQFGMIPRGQEFLYPLIACCYIFCLSPANYLIREFLKYCHVQAQESDLRQTKINGMVIGSAERFLVLTFILTGNFEAAGLTVAAKSLLRFNDKDAPRTEYVLVGTLLSIIVALVSALVIFKFGMEISLIRFKV